MKPSNLQTPRTQADAILLPSFDPIERLQQQRNRTADLVVVVASAVAAVACAVIIIVWG